MSREHQERDETAGVETGLLYEFADGELSDAEQRAVLLRLDGDPDGWRRLALAFVETQRWGRELGGVVKRDLPAPSAKVCHPGDGAAGDPLTPGLSPRGEGGRVREREGALGGARGADAPRSPFFRGRLGVSRLRPILGAVATMAAGILVGFVIGRQDGTVHQGTNGGASVAVQAPRRSEADAPAPRTPAAESYRVAQVGFTDPVSGELRQVEAAVLGPPGSPVLRLTTPISELPEGLRGLLDETALEIVTTQRVYPLQLETGRRVMLVGDGGSEVRLPPPVRRAVY